MMQLAFLVKSPLLCTEIMTTYLIPFILGLHSEDTTQKVRVTAKILGTAMHDTVRTPFEGILKWRRSKGSIN